MQFYTPLGVVLSDGRQIGQFVIEVSSFKTDFFLVLKKQKSMLRKSNGASHQEQSNEILKN